jgi:glucose-6-phosphate 1-epimerase
MEALQHPALTWDKSASLPLIRLKTPDFEAEILTQGAQLMHFAPTGQDSWIFRSPNTPYTPEREIYGGIPVIFPWFGHLKGHPEAPNHAFVRQANWQVDEVSPDGSHITFSLSDAQVKEQGIDTSLWPHPFQARIHFWFGETLRVRFEVENIGPKAVEFTCALHTYYATDTATTRVGGLDGETIETLGGTARKTQNGDITFETRVTKGFPISGGPLTIRDAHRSFLLTPNEGWRSTILWNPGEAMEDLSAEDARSFVCVEAGAIQASAISLEAGATYALDFSVALS